MIMDFFSKKENLGQLNRRLVLSEILFKSPIPRAKIAESISLTQASVSRITRELLDARIIVEGEAFPSDNRRGRQFIGLSLNPFGCYVGRTALVFELAERNCGSCSPV